MQMKLSDWNANIFNTRKAVDYYAAHGLSVAESIVLRRVRDAYDGKRVLDLGVGAGRTTPALHLLASHYCGVDLSSEMLAAARRRYPGATFLQRDIRSLGALPDQPYDFVLASCNLFDLLEHDERLGVLRDIRDLMAPNGTLLFSAHNLDWEDAGSRPSLAMPRSPVAACRRLLGHTIDMANYRRLAALESRGPGHALLRDRAHHWSGVFYYVDSRTQTQQLAELGFSDIEVLGDDGAVLRDGDDTSAHSSLFYVCRKRA